MNCIWDLRTKSCSLYSSCTLTGVEAPGAMTLTAPAKGTTTVSLAGTTMPLLATLSPPKPPKAFWEA